MAGLGTQDQDEACDDLTKEGELTNGKVVVQEKTIEQFRQELIDDLFRGVAKETASAVTFTKNGDYYSAHLAEAKIKGLHKALSIILEASTIVVKEK